MRRMLPTHSHEASKNGCNKGNSCCCHHEQNERVFGLVFLLIVVFVNVVFIVVVDADTVPRGVLIFLSCSHFVGGFGIFLRNAIRRFLFRVIVGCVWLGIV